MELHYLALVVVGVCLPLHQVTGEQDSSCYYEDAGEWSACYPRTKQQTMAQFLVDGEDSCAQTKTKTRPCTPITADEEETDEESKDKSKDSSCEYENAGEWSACYPRTKQQTMAQFLVEGDDTCPQTKTKTRSCTPEPSEEGKKDRPKDDPGQPRRSRKGFPKEMFVRIGGPHNGDSADHTGHEESQHTKKISLSDILQKIFGGHGSMEHGRSGHQRPSHSHEHHHTDGGNRKRRMRTQPGHGGHHGSGNRPANRPTNRPGNHHGSRRGSRRGNYYGYGNHPGFGNRVYTRRIVIG